MKYDHYIVFYQILYQYVSALVQNKNRTIALNLLYSRVKTVLLSML